MRARASGRAVVYVVVVIILVSAAQPALSIDGTPSWLGSTVQGPQASMYVSSPALAFDHYGTPAISWSFVSTIGGTNSVRHSQFTGLGLWAHRELAAGSSIGLQTSLAFDRAERPAISWLNADGTVSGQFDFGAVQQVGTGADSTYPVVTVSYDLAGDMRGTYLRSTPLGSFYEISHDGGNFSSQSMVTVSDAGTILDAALETDYRGMRHLIAREVVGGGSSRAVLLASEASSSVWAWARLVTATDVRGVDIAVDPADGRIGLAYTTYDDGSGRSKLYYAKFNGVSFSTTEILSLLNDSLEDVSLAYDLSDGKPAIAYEREIASPFSQRLYLAYMSGIQWQQSLVDDTISMDAFSNRPRRPSLAFDDYGTSWPAIAYVDADESLRVAFDPPGETPEPATLCLVLLSLAIIPRRVK